MRRVDILDNILRIYNEFDFPFILFSDLNSEYKKYEYFFDIDESYNICLDFLQDYDPSILSLFQNIRSFDKKSFRYKSNEVEPEAENSFNLRTGEVTIKVNNTVEDIFAQVHELIHKIDAPKDSINRNLILTEVIPMTIELYINEFLVDNDICMNDSISYVYNRMLYSVANAYFIRYLYFIDSLPKKLCVTLKMLNKERYNSYLESLFMQLPDYLRDNFLANYKDYNRVIEENNYTYDCKAAELTFRYIYGFSIAPYLFQKNDKELINYVNKASYDEALELPEIKEEDVLKSLRNHYNMIVNLMDFADDYEDVLSFGEPVYNGDDKSCLKMS